MPSAVWSIHLVIWVVLHRSRARWTMAVRKTAKAGIVRKTTVAMVIWKVVEVKAIAEAVAIGSIACRRAQLQLQACLPKPGSDIWQRLLWKQL